MNEPTNQVTRHMLTVLVSSLEVHAGIATVGLALVPHMPSRVELRR